LANKGISHEPGHNRHGILGEAEVEVLFVAEALETLGSAVPAQRLLRTREIQVHYTLCLLVKHSSLLL
jgi:hypothetical protein